MKWDLASIGEYLSGLPVVSSHEHHLEGPEQGGLTLDGILRHSYVGWCSLPESNTVKARARWLDSIRTNTYFIWLERAICSLYGFEEISAENWERVSECIQGKHQDAGWHWTILQQHAGYQRFIQDSYWRTGDVQSKPELVSSAYRMDSWMACFGPECRDHDGNNPRSFISGTMDSLDAFEAALRADILAKRSDVVAFKCAAAYERAIRFDRPSKSDAERVFGRRTGDVNQSEKALFGDYIFHLFLDYAREWALPVQVHTGLAWLPGSSPMLLQPAIAQNPDVKFVLFHGGFPWSGEVAALAHNHSNVYLDMNWLPLVSTSAAVAALHTFLDIIPDAGHIAWGGDAWTSEESLGAIMAFRHVVAQVLSEKHATSLFRARDVECIARKLMYENAANLYGFMD